MKSGKLPLAVFFAFVTMWILLVYYTVLPWLLGVVLDTNKTIDISLLTWFLVVLSMITSVLWYTIQFAYLFVRKRAINRQICLIRQKRWDTHQALVSIIIPARNEEAVIKRTVVSCLAQTYKNIEVVVVCHNCNDGTYETAQSGDNRIRVFDYKTKEAGKGIALNFGVQKSKGEYLLIIDSDAILANDFIANTLPLFDKGYAAVQGQIIASNTEYNILTKLLAMEGYLFSTPFMVIRSLLDERTPLGGTGYMIRKDTLESVGGFRNALIDDFELSFRLYRNKHRIGFAPLSVVYDEKPAELALMFNQRSRWVKGHFDLLRERIPERTDVIGTIYWLSPVFMVAGLLAIVICSFAVIHYFLLGIVPYQFSFVPIKIWLAMTFGGFVVHVTVLLRDFGIRGLKYTGHVALLAIFYHYWYATLIKSFFVKSWTQTKTTHGFISERDIELLIAEQNKKRRH